MVSLGFTFWIYMNYIFSILKKNYFSKVKNMCSQLFFLWMAFKHAKDPINKKSKLNSSSNNYINNRGKTHFKTSLWVTKFSQNYIVIFLGRLTIQNKTWVSCQKERKHWPTLSLGSNISLTIRTPWRYPWPSGLHGDTKEDRLRDLMWPF